MVTEYEEMRENYNLQKNHLCWNRYSDRDIITVRYIVRICGLLI